MKNLIFLVLLFSYCLGGYIIYKINKLPWEKTTIIEKVVEKIVTEKEQVGSFNFLRVKWNEAQEEISLQFTDDYQWSLQPPQGNTLILKRLQRK